MCDIRTFNTCTGVIQKHKVTTLEIKLRRSEESDCPYTFPNQLVKSAFRKGFPRLNPARE